MKKLLILAYDYPPYVSVGAIRPYNWQRYLKEYGVEPIVITRQWANHYGNNLDYISASETRDVIEEKNDLGITYRTPYRPNLSNRLLLKYGESRFKLIRKIISGFYEFVQYIFPIGPKSELYSFARKYLKENKVDAIIATGDPFVLFSYANKLGKEFNIPWFADYRDPWSQNFSSKKGFFQRKLDLILERKIVKSSAKIITVDKLFELKIQKIFPEKKILIQPNGFDEDEMKKVVSITQNADILTFSFIGTIYRWHPIEQLLKDFSTFQLNNPNSQFRLKFYGINCPEKIEHLLIDHFPNLKNHVHIYPKLPNGELLMELAADHVLILFNYYNFTGTKIYDYLGLKRKIIMCYKNSTEANVLKDRYYFHSIETDILPQIDIINETNSGIIVQNSIHLIEIIGELYNEFQTNKCIACESNGIEKYSRKIQVQNLAQLVKNLK